MLKKAVFLDRDGVINVDYGYVHSREDFVLLSGATQALRALQEAGYALVILTNQSGIARGLYTEQDFQALCLYMDELLAAEGVRKIPVYHCPHLGEQCDCRKPKTGMFYQAARDLGLSFEGSWAIGDKLRDLAICKEEPVRGILISKKRIEGWITCTSLLEAARQILSGNSMR